MNSLPGVRELVRLRPGEADHHLALAHWILSSKSFAIKTLQKEEVCYRHREINHKLAQLSSLLKRVSPIFTSTPNSAA